MAQPNTLQRLFPINTANVDATDTGQQSIQAVATDIALQERRSAAQALLQQTTTNRPITQIRTQVAQAKQRFEGGTGQQGIPCRIYRIVWTPGASDNYAFINPRPCLGFRGEGYESCALCRQWMVQNSGRLNTFFGMNPGNNFRMANLLRDPHCLMKMFPNLKFAPSVANLRENL